MSPHEYYVFLSSSFLRKDVGRHCNQNTRHARGIDTAVHIEPYSQKRCRQGGRRADRFMGRSDDSLRRGSALVQHHRQPNRSACSLRFFAEHATGSFRQIHPHFRRTNRRNYTAVSRITHHNRHLQRTQLCQYDAADGDSCADAADRAASPSRC